MFYGAFVLAKKGPLAKVWLAAHWDKKLTKAHVFETDVESTVDNIISPQVKMALRTSGHLLLGVVRIYSRKQKYLIHDLGEACAKIKMAFRPGIVDLPADGGVDNADAITLPEIFHDFETAVADLGTLDLEAQYTINPSRAAEITIADTVPGHDMFGDEFGDLGLMGGDFGGGMDDIEVPRAKSITFADEKDITEKSNMQISDLTNGTTLPEDPAKRINDFTLEERLPDANDFGVDGGFFLEDGFGPGDGGLADFVDMPTVSDITLDQPNKTPEREEGEKGQGESDKETPMEVDQPEAGGDEHTPERESEPAVEEAPKSADTTVVPVGEEGFVLEPLDMTGRGKERVKRKRRLVVDSDKEFPGTQIKAQFQDFRDLLQPKCFPPPTKKAMMWKEMAGCDQLFSRPTAPLLLGELSELVTRNYSTVIPGEVAVEAPITLEEPTSARDADVSKNTTTAEKEVLRDNKEGPTTLNDTTLGETTVPEGEITELPPEGGDNLMMDDFGLGGGLGEDRPFDDVGPAAGLEEKSSTTMEADEPTSRVIPDLPDLDDIPSVQSSEEQMSNELSEEFEQRRWTKRTQQVLRVLGRNLSGKESIQFSSLTQRCSRKQAASRFYTCLLLAKEGMIDVKQDGPYADIAIQKGPKFTEVF